MTDPDFIGEVLGIIAVFGAALLIYLPFGLMERRWKRKVRR